jgi:TRAP-type C4-dicarboxylate transport system substrate-binding protein
MSFDRREVLRAAAATALATLSLPSLSQATGPLKMSHQFPGGSLTEGDFRDRLCRKFAIEAEKRTNGALKASVYPGSSLMKTNAQFSSMRKGALDMSLVPLSYAGGEVAETNIGLMPALVPSYDVGVAWKNADIGKQLAKMLDEKGIIVVSWVWQAGGVASRGRPLVTPDDARGLKVRGGSREMDMMLKTAGASVITLPSNEIYAAMQTGAMDAAMTSSTSFISFKLEEIAKHPRDAAKADDEAAATIYAKAGAKIYDMDEATLKKWQAIARDTAWKDFADRNESCAGLLKAAQKLL